MTKNIVSMAFTEYEWRLIEQGLRLASSATATLMANKITENLLHESHAEHAVYGHDPKGRLSSEWIPKTESIVRVSYVDDGR